ncbi:MAG TPA: glycosyltransferase, partial [Solirubrobacterales bacterium]|nr:glycosyltransferase [Solirubrobacterales bacterium]
VPTAATAFGMPRIDLHDEVNPPSDWVADDRGSAADPLRHSYRSGFWATVPVWMPATGSVTIAVRAGLEGGGSATMPLAPIAAAPAPAPAAVTGEPALAICMATWEPDPDLLAVQVESIRAQVESDWVCLISDDCSSPEGYAAIERAVGDDPRFVLSRSPRRLGFYRNFERALSMVPAGTELVALSDQDDHWYPEKLATLRSALGRAQLVYSDQRLVGPDGEVLAESYWSGGRSRNDTNFASLLIANTITGAASLFRRELLEVALPFPDPPGVQYQDHWLGLCALATGRIAYVDRPLYDYVQHGGALLGHEAANRISAGGGDEVTPRGLFSRLIAAARGSRAAYFDGYCRLRVLAATLLMRAGPRLRARPARVLHRFAAAEGSPLALAWLELRRLRNRLGRTETMGAERIIAAGLLWRRGIAAIGALRGQPIPGLPYDAQLPDRDPAPEGLGGLGHERTVVLGGLVEPLELTVSEDEPERVNMLLPTIELRHLFGGYITKFNLARRLAESGLRVRILTVDPTPALPADWREQVESYAGLAGLFETVEVAFARDRDAPVAINPRDRFVATTWWTAHIAAAAVGRTERTRFLYLIQEFEPYTHPMGSWAAYALSTYELPHVALFSTALLRDFFAARGYGVFAAGETEGRERSVAFENAITAVTPPTAAELAARDGKALLFYARPEPHGARNMFELGLLGLARAIERGTFGPEWTFHGIGSVEGRDRTVGLPGGRSLELLNRRDQGSYAELLVGHDVGLALMSTPHPSLVPLEMASAGLLTVTNSWETKTAAAMAALSPNLIAVPPGIDGIAAGLAEAAAGAGEHERRIAGAVVDWSRDWDHAFDTTTMAAVLGLLDAC